jgi:hypothetical protein
MNKNSTQNASPHKSHWQLQSHPNPTSPATLYRHHNYQQTETTHLPPAPTSKDNQSHKLLKELTFLDLSDQMSIIWLQHGSWRIQTGLGRWV